MEEVKSKGKSKFLLNCFIYFAFISCLQPFVFLILHFVNPDNYSIELVKIGFIINIPIFLIFSIIAILLMKFYYKLRFFSRDKLVEDEEGKIIIEKYDKELEDKVDKSLSKVEETMKE